MSAAWLLDLRGASSGDYASNSPVYDVMLIPACGRENLFGNLHSSQAISTRRSFKFGRRRFFFG